MHIEQIVIEHLRQLPTELHDDFERAVANFVDEQLRMLAICQEYEDRQDGERYLLECFNLREMECVGVY